MLRTTLALCAAALVAAAAPSPASAASQGCPASSHGPATVEMDVLDGGVVYDHSRSAAQITGLAVTSGVHAHTLGHSSVRGLTAASFRSGFSVSVAYAKLPGGAVCVRPVALRVTVGYDPTTVYLQRDYPAGSCQYQRILEHEEGHVRINREVFAQFLPMIRAAMEMNANHPAYPVWAADVESGKAVITAALQAAMQVPVKAMQERRNQMHAVLDSPKSYKATQDACASW